MMGHYTIRAFVAFLRTLVSVLRLSKEIRPVMSAHDGTQSSMSGLLHVVGRSNHARSPREWAGPIATAERLGKCYMHPDSTAL